MPVPPPPDTPFDVATQWVELMGAATPGGTSMFSEQNGSAAIGILTEQKYESAIYRQARGISWCDAGTPYRLYRLNPLRHPKPGYNWLWSYRAALTDKQPVGNFANPNRGAYVLTPYAPYGSTSLIPKFGKYAKTEGIIEFGPKFFPIIDDADFGQTWYANEWDRNVDFDSDLTTETNVLSAQTGRFMTFVETTAPNGPSLAGTGTQFPGEIGERLQKSTLTWTWYGVPREYIFNAAGVPVKLNAGLNCVNLNPFRGYAAGTLLLLGVSFAKLPLPWLWQSYLPAYEYHVTFHVSFFDPVPALGNGAAFRGHNLFPWSQGPASNGSIWYAATRGGFPPANEKNRYLQSYDFAKLFDHVLKP